MLLNLYFSPVYLSFIGGGISAKNLEGWRAKLFSSPTYVTYFNNVFHNLVSKFEIL